MSGGCLVHGRLPAAHEIIYHGLIHIVNHLLLGLKTPLNCSNETSPLDPLWGVPHRLSTIKMREVGLLSIVVVWFVTCT
jgi:hypothetical protein